MPTFSEAIEVAPTPPNVDTIAIDGVTNNTGRGSVAVQGRASGGVGVHGTSAGFDAVVGETNSDAHAGVTGRNLTNGANGGVGLYGVGGKFAGKFDGDVQINGHLHVSGANVGDVLSQLLNRVSAVEQHITQNLK
jgi:hypothetical protein